MGSTGVVTGIDPDLDAEVTYPSGSKWTFNPAVLTLAKKSSDTGGDENSLNNHKGVPIRKLSVSCLPNKSSYFDEIQSEMKIKDNEPNESSSEFFVGDLVEISSDIELAKKLQRGHGEWTNEMGSV